MTTMNKSVPFKDGDNLDLYLSTASKYTVYIEDLIERENVFTMQEFSDSINAFLEFRQYKILKDNGKVTHKQAQEKAYTEYEIYNKKQTYWFRPFTRMYRKTNQLFKRK